MGEFSTIRIVYTIMSFLIAVISYCFHEKIITEQTNLNYFSYIGTVATIIGLIIAVCEIVHSITITKSIQKEAQKLLQQVQEIEIASNISYCLTAIDEVSLEVSYDNYVSALKCFQFLRKISVKTTALINNGEKNKLSTLSDIELLLQQYKHSTDTAPVTKPQKKALLQKLLILKQEFEKENPTRGQKNVTE